MVAVTVALAAGVWLTAVLRWRMPGQSLRKRAFTAAGPTDAHNLRCLWLTALVATLYIRPVSEFIDAVTNVPGLAATLMFSLLIIGSAELLMALRAITLPPELARTGSWRRGTATVAVVAGLILTLLAGQPGHSDVSQRWDSPGWMAAYWALWLGWCLAASGRATSVALRYARGIGPSRLRTSVAFLALGATALGMYALVKSVAIAAVVRGSDPHPVVPWLILVAVTVMAISAVIASSWTVAGQRVEHSRRAAKLRKIQPLWEQLSALDVGIALHPFPADVTRLTVEQGREALYRACIEIRDWMRLLSQRLPANAWDEALTLTDGIPEPRRGWVATAGWIHAGLHSPTEAAGPSSAMPPIGRDVDEMERLLIGVAQVPTAQAEQIGEEITSRTWETTQ